MPFKLIIRWGANAYDYTRYLLHQSFQINESLNTPSQASFSLGPVDQLFVIPPQRAYVDFFSTLRNKSLYTGYISSNPVRSFMGSTNPLIMGGQQLQYDFSCVSDEHIVNIKAVQFIPAFINRYQGEILADIAEVLCPGFYDLSMLEPGDLVPFFQYSPDQSWSEIAKSFGDPSRYRVKARNKFLIYTPYGDKPLGISYDERKPQSTFDPRGLTTSIMNVPTVNDVTIIGQVEAGNNREDYFVGDGFTGNFPLRHKMFQGASTLLLQETWNGNSLNRQNWWLEDITNEFDFTAGALNIVTPAPTHPLGQSYLQMLNAIEVSGALDIEHGEITFNDYCAGVIGGIYRNAEAFHEGNLIAGFELLTPGTIVYPPPIPGTGVQGIGVGGVHIRAYYEAQNIGDEIVTEPNHTYILQTLITAPRYARYNLAYRTMAGETFGGDTNTIKASITWTVQDYNIVEAKQFYYTPKITKIAELEVELPAFVVYLLINNGRLNLTLTRTTIAGMPEGALFALTGPLGLSQPTGYLPMLPEHSGGFIGPVLPWPGPASHNIWPGPLPLNTVAVQEVLGNGLQLTVAQITAGNETDTLAFYFETLPVAGTQIRLQSYEAQAAVSRLQNAESIAEEQTVVGDDGIRSAIIDNLNPLPRTSEDCDNAALAFLKDRSRILYDGNYVCTSLFFAPFSGSDWQYYPTVGRFFDVYAPQRGITDQKYLCTSLTMGILDMSSEIIAFNIGFGADLYLEKLLANFVNTQPNNVLSPKDKANPPNPRYTQQAHTSYLPDLNNVQVDMLAITSDYVMIDVFDAYAGPIEVRLQDYNWGLIDTADYVGEAFGPRFRLQRRQIDQTWYMRPSEGGKTSRRSKVVRVVYPRRPDRPAYIGATAILEPTGPNNAMTESFEVQFGMTGDIRNIWGFELRAADDTTILVQKMLTSAASDLLINMAQTAMPWLPPPYDTDFSVYAYFFNVRWEYSFALPIDIRKLATLSLPYVWSPGWTRTLRGDTFQQPANFGVQPFYKMTEDGTPLVSFTIKGQPPVNLVSNVVGEPVILNAYVVVDVGNPLYQLGPGTYGVGVSASDGDPPGMFGQSMMSDIRVLEVTEPWSAIHVDIDPPTNSMHMDTFISYPNDQQKWFWYETVPGQTSAVAILNVPYDRTGAPDDEFDNFVIEYKIEFHSGILGAQIQPNGVTYNTLKIGGVGIDGEEFFFVPGSLIGRVVSMLALYDPDLDIPIANYKIVANDETTITVGPNQYGEDPPDLNTIFHDLDVVTVRMKPTYTSNGFFDPMLINPFAKTGLEPDEEKGRLAWVIDGYGRGQVRGIASNTETSFTLTEDWETIPNDTSCIIIVDNQWQPGYRTQGYKMANRYVFPGGPVAQPDIQNLGGVTWLMRVITAASDGRADVSDLNIPLREAYAFPAYGSSQEDVGIISYETEGGVVFRTRGVGKRGIFNMKDARDAKEIATGNYRIINGVYVKSILR